MKNVAVLLSGRGSNFIALASAVERGEIPARICLVVSNRREAAGLEKAAEMSLPRRFVESQGRDREDFDREVASHLQDAGADVVCLAGFMRLLSPWFVSRFPRRILNIHPSLLPAFPGLHAQRQALEWGVKVTGCTVHLVDEELDHGPIILQRTVPVRDDDSEESLSERILKVEHEIYPEALGLVCQDRVRVEGRRALILDSP
ncbi:MAG TPA: phosphoribosylglycinamide formyltransferase [Acidobacteriota bacterium]|nr:phosphoribosylglycinamide formyltransferase [Acidobacteriota bacterium]